MKKLDNSMYKFTLVDTAAFRLPALGKLYVHSKQSLKTQINMEISFHAECINYCFLI